jgi:hypothetical protein
MGRVEVTTKPPLGQAGQTRSATSPTMHKTNTSSRNFNKDQIVRAESIFKEAEFYNTQNISE